MVLQVGGRVRTFLSLVAHADGDGIMVGARNTIDVTIECQVHVGGLSYFLQDWRTSVPAKMLSRRLEAWLYHIHLVR